jgi:hypothetical protein
MIAFAKESTHQQYDKFIAMIPVITRYSATCFRHLDAEAREDAVAEIVANCFRAYVRLVELNKEDLVYPAVLASFAVRQYRDGRRVGSKLNKNDISSPYCQRFKRINVERLDRHDKRAGGWQEVLAEDRHAGPADTAASRIDFSDWLASLPSRDRRIAEQLGSGERAREVAEQFGVSASRVSQLRRELMENWQLFHSEPTVSDCRDTDNRSLATVGG